MEKVRACYKKGPIRKLDWEKEVIVSWGRKILDRAHMGDIKGNFRAHWLVYDLLKGYFQLRHLWYLGPKEAFQWIKIKDIETYDSF